MQILLRNDTLCNFCSTEIVIRWLLHFVLHRRTGRLCSQLSALLCTRTRLAVRACEVRWSRTHSPMCQDTCLLYQASVFIHIHIDSVPTLELCSTLQYYKYLSRYSRIPKSCSFSDVFPFLFLFGTSCPYLDRRFFSSVMDQFDDFRDDYAFLLKKSENQDDFLKSLFFDLQKCVIPQKNPQKNRHSILK